MNMDTYEGIDAKQVKDLYEAMESSRSDKASLFLAYQWVAAQTPLSVSWFSLQYDNLRMIQDLHNRYGFLPKKLRKTLYIQLTALRKWRDGARPLLPDLCRRLVEDFLEKVTASAVRLLESETSDAAAAEKDAENEAAYPW